MFRFFMFCIFCLQGTWVYALSSQSIVQGQVVAVEEDHIKVRYKDQKGQTQTVELTRGFFADDELKPGISEILVDLGAGGEQSQAR